MTHFVQRLIFAGAAFALPLSASAHGSEFLVAKALVQTDGRVLLEITADYGDNPMIANEAEAATAVQRALRIADGAAKLAAPRLEKRTQPDPDSPLPPDPFMTGKPHQLLTAVWQIIPVSETLRFAVPDAAGQTVILWTKNLLHPEEKTHWVMLVPGEQSPPIITSRKAQLSPPYLLSICAIGIVASVAARRLLLRFRVVLGLFIVGLIISGVTAFPLLHELQFLARMLGIPPDARPADLTGLAHWIATVREGLEVTYQNYPWMAYGTDWLAFGHLMIALFFIGPWRDPIANAWVLRVGIAVCALVIPLAMICGAVRGIPFYWRLIDCSFGVLGAIPLAYCLVLVKRMKAELAQSSSVERL